MVGSGRKTHGEPQPAQRLKFEQAARELGCDESEDRFDAALRKVASSPPTPKPTPKGKPEAKKPAK